MNENLCSPGRKRPGLRAKRAMKIERIASRCGADEASALHRLEKL